MNHYISSSKIYELFFPDDWTHKEGKDCVSFFDSQNGVGTIQISSYSSPERSKKDNLSILSEYLGNKNIKINKEYLEIEKNGDVSIAKYSYSQENIFWSIWFISKNNKIIFSTYNCDVNDKKMEYSIIENIIESINIF